MAAKHLEIAKREGAQAGMLAYLSTPISKLSSKHYSTIIGKRTDKTRLAAYCNAFGISQKAAPIAAPSSMEQIQAQIDALQAKLNPAPVVEIDPLEALMAQVAELQAQIAGTTVEAAKPRLLKPRPWDLTGKSVGKDGTFVHITKGTKNRGPERITYKALSFDEAVEALTACYEANVRYVVRAS